MNAARSAAADRIRAENLVDGRRIAVLDDDPTGSQCVHGVSVAMTVSAEAFRPGLRDAGDTCFILTNTRGLDEGSAVSLTRQAVKDLFSLDLDGPLDIVSRSDSTLRGHVVAEINAIADAYERASGNGVDGVLFCPAMMEAGRTTAGDVHFAKVNGEDIPVGETEFARDSTFGYRSSNLRDFLAEKSSGAVRNITSISLETIRTGGTDAVADLLKRVSDLTWVVVNATSYDDLETVVLGLRQAQRAGKHFIYRSGPSFVRPLAGLGPVDVLQPADIDIETRRKPHGLVVIGSHVGLTTRQVRAAQNLRTLTEIELDVPTLLGPDGDTHIQAAIDRVVRGLDHSDVLIYTSRDLVTADSPEASLRLSMRVSDAVVRIVAATRDALPAWVVAKGGITSHEVAVRGLGIRRATVVGQFLPGQISLFRPEEAPSDVLGCPYVVFPGNVGSDGALAHVISVMHDAVGLKRAAGATTDQRDEGTE